MGKGGRKKFLIWAERLSYICTDGRKDFLSQVKRMVFSIRCARKENPFLGFTVGHHSASLVMPNSDPHDRLF